MVHESVSGLRRRSRPQLAIALKLAENLNNYLNIWRIDCQASPRWSCANR